MRRKALLKDGDQFSVLEESEFDAEDALQDALKRNPEVIPVTDLDLGPCVVVGRETSVPPGAIDLLLVDTGGHVVILETKLARNPELRRQVVAQVLDYGAGLWKVASDLRSFEALALDYWRSSACEDKRVKEAKTLREGLEPILEQAGEEGWNYDQFEASLEDNLASGSHVLLVVASGLMDKLSRDLLEYVNACLGVPLYGVEIDVFETEGRQLIVPRGVRYSARTGGAGRPRPPVFDRASLLAECTPVARSFFEQVLQEAEERGMSFRWGSVSFTVRITMGESKLSVMYCSPPGQLDVYSGELPFDDQARAAFHDRLSEIAPFVLGGQYTNRLPITEETEKEARAALAFVWETIEEIMSGPQGGR
jgi:hypothetical protein